MAKLSESAVPETVLITFYAGSIGWERASRRLEREAGGTGLFHSILRLNEKWLAQEDPQIYEIVQKFQESGQSKGFGYWIWKTACLDWASRKYPNQQILYIDAGHHISAMREDRSTVLQILQTSIMKGGFAWQLPNHPESAWSKAEVLRRFDVEGKYEQSNQIQAGFICLPPGIQRNMFTRDFREAARERNGFFFSDETSLSQKSEFKAHRHDQSILSLLWKGFNFHHEKDRTFPENIGNYPIIAARNNTFLPGTWPPLTLKIARRLDLFADKFLSSKKIIFNFPPFLRKK
jgi:hypothetical protein